MVRSGYKQTDVGILPDDWRLDRVDAHACIGTGSRNTQDRVEDGEYPFFVRSQHVERIYTYSFDGEAVLTAGDGVGTGKIYHYIDGRFDVHQRVYRMTDFSDQLNGKYFFYQFKTRFFERIMSMTAKSSVDSVRLEMIAGMLIPLPSTAEQEAIAGALSDADALIESLEALIAKKRQIKQGAMQELLTGKTRLPGFSGKWDERSLRQIVSTPITDGPHMTPQFVSDGIPFLSVNNLADGKIDFTDLRYVTVEDHAIFSRKCKPKRNDVLLGKAASVGKVAIVDSDLELNIWSPIALVRVGDDHVPRFIYYQLQSSNTAKQIVLLTNSSSQGNIGMGDIEKIALLLPSKPEQSAIAAVLSDMDAEIAALEAKLAKSRQVKQGMMQELLTGRIRLI